MQTVELFGAKVKYAAQKTPLDTQNGPRINCVVTLEATGEEIKLWGNPDDLIAYLSKGDRIQLSRDGKGRWSIVGAPPEPQTQKQGATQKQGQVTATATGMPTAPVHATSEDVRQWAAIYRELRAALPEAEPDTWRAGASCIFNHRCQMAKNLF